MPDGMPPALVVERFDVRRGSQDRRRLALEIFARFWPTSLSTIRRHDRTHGKKSASALDQTGFGPRRLVPARYLRLTDRRFRHAFEEPCVAEDWGCRRKEVHRRGLAPLYDAVVTRVLLGRETDRMALKLNGKDDRLSLEDFLALARPIGLKTGAAETAINELAVRQAKRGVALGLPDFTGQTKAAIYARGKVIAIVRQRVAALAG